MTHPFHTGRYNGAATIPKTGGPPVQAAALVLHHERLVPIDPMFAQLDAKPAQRPIRSVRLLPVQAVDFYARPEHAKAA